MKIVVVGSGVSGTHAALTLLERNFDVELWDVGREVDSFIEKGVTFNDLKNILNDTSTYFLGSDALSALISPESEELLRYPPSRTFLASKNDPLWSFKSNSFFPFASFTEGGLANGWGANALSFDENDLADWPISFSDMEPAYSKVYKRIAVAGPLKDHLTSHLSGVYPSQPPVKLSSADQVLLNSYSKKKSQLHRLGIKIGLARLAMITDPEREDACDYCDRCLWGCPHNSIYNPSFSTLKQCHTFSRFNYITGRYALSLSSNKNKITGIHYLDIETQQILHDKCDAVFLAAGALASGAIFLRTLKTARPDIPAETEGLMDTRVVKLPYVLLRQLGRPSDKRAFQFNRLIMGIINDHASWPRYLHGEVLHLTSLLYYPLIEWMPFGSKFSKRIFFAIKSSLGTVSLFFPDKITPGNRQTLVSDGRRWDSVHLSYQESAGKNDYIERSIKNVRSGLLRLGCVPKGIIYSPPGAGIHYAGTIPMGKGIKNCDTLGKSNLFSNLFITDGAAFPSLPSKSITLSLAAHATRTALNARL